MASRCASSRCARLIAAYLDAGAGASRIFVAGFLAVVVASFALAPFLGRNFFPTVDSGEINLHVRAPIGTRIEETAALFDHIESEHPPGHSARSARFNRRQYRPAGQRHQPRLFQCRRRGPGRRRHPCHAEARITAHRRLCQDAAHGLAARAFPARPFPSCPPISSARF